MSKTIKANALFLAVVLVSGTLALTAPSLLRGAEAVADYGYNNDYNKKYPSYGNDNYKSKYQSSKDVFFKKFSCTNVNINLNGANVDVGSVFGDSIAAQAAQQDSTSANSFGSGDRSQKFFSDKDLVILCNFINKNEGQQPVPPVDRDCAFCVAQLSPELRSAIDSALTGNLQIPGTDIVITADGIDELCNWLEENGPLELTVEQIIGAVELFLAGSEDISVVDVVRFIICLIDSGDIEVVEDGTTEPPEENCETCNDAFGEYPEILAAILGEVGGGATIGGVTFPVGTDTLQELCAILEGPIAGPILTGLEAQELATALDNLLDDETVDDDLLGFATCLLEALTTAP